MVLGVRLGFAMPVQARAMAPSVSISPSSGPGGTTINVTGSGIVDSNNTPLQTGTVSYGYSTSTDTACNSPSFVGTGSNTTWPSAGSFSGSFVFPTGVATGTYTICVSISNSNPGVIPGSNSFQVTSAATVSADQSSYTVGDNITVSGTGFPASTSVSIELQSSDGVTTTPLGSVNSDISGSFSQDYTVPAHPLNSVVVIATYGSGQQATSNSFTVNAKATTSKPKPTPAPIPTTAPAPAVVIVATPTPAPVPTDTPTAVPTDTPTPALTPTVAAQPAPVHTAVNQTSSTPFNSNLVVGLAIGLGALLGLGLLFLVGRLLLRKISTPAPSPGGMGSQYQSQQGDPWNPGVPFGQMTPYNGPPQPTGSFMPGPIYESPTQQMPMNAPLPVGTGGFAPGAGFEPPTRQMPVNSPFPPGNGGFAPTGVAQEPFPPPDWLSPSQ